MRSLRLGGGPLLGVVALCWSFTLIVTSASAATTYVDGISDQNLTEWDAGFSGSYFGGLFASDWVTGGHIRYARYVVQWNAMAEGLTGANDYRERYEAWLEDAHQLGLMLDLSLTSYDEAYPSTSAEYQRALEQLLAEAKLKGDDIRYVEPWNEPNNQGAEPAVNAAHFTNSAHSLCVDRTEAFDCTILAGNFEDGPRVAEYEQAYEENLNQTPLVWGIHPYHSVQEMQEGPYLQVLKHLPYAGGGEQVWFTEIAARRCTSSGGNSESGQARRAEWLVKTLMPTRKPEHVFYYGFLLGHRRQPGCAGEPLDGELYAPSNDPNAPDVARAAASLILNDENFPWPAA
jgi:hypothetical protein